MDRIEIRELYARPTAEYPQGSYLRRVAGVVEMATGKYARIYPGRESPYRHGGPPFFIVGES